MRVSTRRQFDTRDPSSKGYYGSIHLCEGHLHMNLALLKQLLCYDIIYTFLEGTNLFFTYLISFVLARILLFFFCSLLRCFAAAGQAAHGRSTCGKAFASAGLGPLQRQGHYGAGQGGAGKPTYLARQKGHENVHIQYT